MKIALKLGTCCSTPCRVDNGVFGDAGHQLLGNLFRGLRPDIDDLVVALAVRDQAFLVLVMNLLDTSAVASARNRGLSGGIIMSSRQIEIPARVALPYPRVRSLSARRTVALSPRRR